MVVLVVVLVLLLSLLTIGVVAKHPMMFRSMHVVGENNNVIESTAKCDSDCNCYFDVFEGICQQCQNGCSDPIGDRSRASYACLECN